MEKVIKEELMYDKIADWLEIYHSTKDKNKKAKAKALIVTRMLPIVKRIARKIARRAYDPLDDLIQAGSIGLLKAIDSFTPEVNENFKFYSGSLIIGEMRHFVRDKMNTIRVPRHIQELSYRINSFISTLTPEELNELTNEYVANALNVPKQDVEFAMLSERRKNTYSLDTAHTEDARHMGYEELFAKENYKDSANLEDARLIIQLVIVRLPKEYRELVELYYYKDYTKAEIAEETGNSPMQVNRKLQKAFELLYEMISDSQLGNSLMEMV